MGRHFGHTRLWKAAVAVTFAATVMMAGVGQAVAADQPTPPTQPAAGALGGAGPCGSSRTDEANKTDWGLWVWLYQPTGTGTPRSGGTCDDAKRPVVFMTHGWGAMWPWWYQGVIDNMVSNGYIVAFANYTSLPAADLDWYADMTYPQVDHGWVQATTMTTRMDLANIGLWSHSYGGGMTPWLSSKVEGHGWGTSSFWILMNDPRYLKKVPADPQDITFPKNTRVLVVNWGTGNDTVLPEYDRMRAPGGTKERVRVLSDNSHPDVKVYTAEHTSSNDCPDGEKFDQLGVYFECHRSHIQYYGLYRNWQALADSARLGAQLGDLTGMGIWSDGIPATAATIMDPPPAR
ncbi:alpha/beta hydrolase family protein [Actinocrispum wychmicini]|uniref:Chlorophyllase-like protein n=1 Tax=Actinocrispum wychmicini TaxID=1213861 RepID=A0A4R2JXQ7_9PSEU|nr:hypothetical protein [Actinocrispum wychmicini]TCO62146.1 hypothetical protein EV192_102283 [Actinocrispum wychmicini]